MELLHEFMHIEIQIIKSFIKYSKHISYTENIYDKTIFTYKFYVWLNLLTRMNLIWICQSTIFTVKTHRIRQDALFSKDAFILLVAIKRTKKLREMAAYRFNSYFSTAVVKYFYIWMLLFLFHFAAEIYRAKTVSVQHRVLLLCRDWSAGYMYIYLENFE